MTLRIPLRCRCGAVQGSLTDVSPTDGKRAVCYCEDCQIYAEHLGRSDILDERGGTEAVMSTPAQVTLTEGASHLRCLRLGPSGLYRWYAACCNTPLGNTLGPRVPILIVPLVSLDFAASGLSVDEALGRPRVQMHGRFAKGGVPPRTHAKVPLGFLPHVASHVLHALLKRRTQPSPFFDRAGAPRVAPQLIDKAEREAIRARVLTAARSDTVQASALR